MMRLLNPQCFGAETIVVRIVGFQRLHPRGHMRQHIGSWPVMQFTSSTVVRSPFVFPQLFENFWNRFSELSCWCDQRTTRVHESINSTASVVSIRVTLTVLHVTNQRIRPVAKPQAHRQGQFADQQVENAYRWIESNHPDCRQRVSIDLREIRLRHHAR